MSTDTVNEKGIVQHNTYQSISTLTSPQTDRHQSQFIQSSSKSTLFTIITNSSTDENSCTQHSIITSQNNGLKTGTINSDGILPNENDKMERDGVLLSPTVNHNSNTEPEGNQHDDGEDDLISLDSADPDCDSDNNSNSDNDTVINEGTDNNGPTTAPAEPAATTDQAIKMHDGGPQPPEDDHQHQQQPERIEHAQLYPGQLETSESEGEGDESSSDTSEYAGESQTGGSESESVEENGSCGGDDSGSDNNSEFGQRRYSRKTGRKRAGKQKGKSNKHVGRNGSSRISARRGHSHGKATVATGTRRSCRVRKRIVTLDGESNSDDDAGDVDDTASGSSSSNSDESDSNGSYNSGKSDSDGDGTNNGSSNIVTGYTGRRRKVVNYNESNLSRASQSSDRYDNSTSRSSDKSRLRTRTRTSTRSNKTRINYGDFDYSGSDIEDEDTFLSQLATSPAVVGRDSIMGGSNSSTAAGGGGGGRGRKKKAKLAGDGGTLTSSQQQAMEIPQQSNMSSSRHGGGGGFNTIVMDLSEDQEAAPRSALEVTCNIDSFELPHHALLAGFGCTLLPQPTSSSSSSSQPQPQHALSVQQQSPQPQSQQGLPSPPQAAQQARTQQYAQPTQGLPYVPTGLDPTLLPADVVYTNVNQANLNSIDHFPSPPSSWVVSQSSDGMERSTVTDDATITATACSNGNSSSSSGGSAKDGHTMTHTASVSQAPSGTVIAPRRSPGNTSRNNLDSDTENSSEDEVVGDDDSVSDSDNEDDLSDNDSNAKAISQPTNSVTSAITNENVLFSKRQRKPMVVLDPSVETTYARGSKRKRDDDSGSVSDSIDSDAESCTAQQSETRTRSVRLSRSSARNMSEYPSGLSNVRVNVSSQTPRTAPWPKTASKNGLTAGSVTSGSKVTNKNSSCGSSKAPQKKAKTSPQKAGGPVVTEAQIRRATEQHMDSPAFARIYKEHHQVIKNTQVDTVRRIEAVDYMYNLTIVDLPPIDKFESSELHKTLISCIISAMSGSNSGNSTSSRRSSKGNNSSGNGSLKDLINRACHCQYMVGNIQEGTEKRIEDAVEMGLVPRLVTLTRDNTNIDTQCAAMNILNQVAFLEPQCVLEAGTIDAILEIAYENSEECIFFHASKILNTLSDSNVVHLLITNRRTMISLLHVYQLMLNTEDTRITINSCSAISYSINTEVNKQSSPLLEPMLTIILGEEGIAFNLMSILSKVKTNNIQAACCMALASILNALPQEQIPNFLRVHNPLPILVSLLLPLKLTRIAVTRSFEACKCLSLLVAYPSRIIHAIPVKDFESGRVLRLLQSYRDDAVSEELQLYAGTVLDVLEDSLTVEK